MCDVNASDVCDGWYCAMLCSILFLFGYSKCREMGQCQGQTKVIFILDKYCYRNIFYFKFMPLIEKKYKSLIESDKGRN